MAGTRFRTMLAPINASTGDGRRFASGGITLDTLPMPFEWARQREGGHDGAVAVGAIQEAAVLTVKEAIAQDYVSVDKAKDLPADMEAVWARGVMFDDADREKMPRLAEDVAESMHLATSGTLGPSVDLDSFEAQPVMAGSDDALDWAAVEAYMDEHDGEEPPIELLITAGRVRAATLVSIPAFAETARPFELMTEETAEDGDGAEMYALVASQGRALPDAGLFALPPLTGPTPITWDWAAGRVYGHIATWATCHVGYEGVCVTPPRESADYSWFNRFTVDTADGPVTAGRITVGGRHAGLAANAAAAMTEYDAKVTAAHVRAFADEHGIVVSGAIEPGLSPETMTVLERRKVSGDWRDIGGQLSLVEVLALSPGPRAHSEPGFPVETHARNGRQVTLVASLGPDPASFRATSPAVDVEDIVRRTLAAERAEAARLAARAHLARTVETYDRELIVAERNALAAVLNGEG